MAIRPLAVMATLALAAACGSGTARRGPRAAAAPELEPLVLYTLRREQRSCVVRESCPPGVACAPRAPYAAVCGYGMGSTYRAPDDEDTGLFARLGDACFDRPTTCNDRSCLGAPHDCPPPPGDPPAVSRWAVHRDGDRCTFTPAPPTSISPEEPPFTIPCPAGYDPPIVGVNRFYPDEDCRIDSGFECPEDALCEPDYTPAVKCPARPGAPADPR